MARALALILRTSFGSWRTSDEDWERIEALLPRPRKDPALGGRPRVPDREVLDGILFVLRTGCKWNALNGMGICSSSTAHARFQEWEAAGVFDRLREAGILDVDASRGIAAGGMLWGLQAARQAA